MSKDRIGQYLDSNKAITSDNLEPEAMTDQPEQSAEEELRKEFLDTRLAIFGLGSPLGKAVLRAMQSFAKQEVKKACNGDTLEELFIKHQEFSIKAFPNSTWESSLRGLEREIIEVEEASYGEDRTTEYVDCFMYLLDSMNRADIDMIDFRDSFISKLIVNRGRSWKQNTDSSYSHIKPKI